MSHQPTEPVRAAVTVAGRRLSYLDFGGEGRVLFALHGHFGEARAFTRLARDLGPEWRVIALDQRGHGFSDRPPDFSRAGYVTDAASVLARLDLGPVVVLGHSLGGVTAFQVAARHPHLVSALVIEDIGPVVDDDLSYALTWPKRSPTRAALLAALGPSAPHVDDAIREFPDGWGLAFHTEDMVASQRELNGDHWDDWLAGTCPALVVHGTKSTVLSHDLAAEMTARRPDTRLARLDTGHAVRQTDPVGFAAIVSDL
ncbi:alpha/beta hydrolase [Herbidospora galbida]|uniref:Alpha/beta hydrolase n=1 Tax=Herbidospora galbida TaxID=2575442 RepID=A0A4V6XBH5_9ACTN|nr:alpha/beta hydrolase [Herbidospora galbida]TKK90453.1 alpha/beta hydrolase [Herbidospora galbida]